MQGAGAAKQGKVLTRVLSVLKLPLHFLALFTQEKSFQGNPLIGSRLLNRMGLHVLRVVIAHAMTQLRWWMLSPLLARAERLAYARDGFLLLPDFLPQAEFAAMEAEMRGFRGEAWQMTQGDTLTEHVFLDRPVLADLPATSRALSGRRFRRLLRYSGSHLALPRMYLQRIANGYANGAADPQKHLHVDTFHPTVKCWLFLDDVTADRGPFTYVPGSQRLSWKRLRWEYRQSLIASDDTNEHHAQGSFRVSEADRVAMGMQRARAVEVRKNTLVIANTYGVHRRGDANGSVSRLEIWGISRKNPYVPWPGLGLNLTARLEEKIVRWVTRDIQQRALAAGREPTWRTVSFAATEPPEVMAKAGANQRAEFP